MEVNKEIKSDIAQLAGAVEYTDCFSAEGKNPPSPTSVLDMTLNNLMVLFTNPSARAGYDTRSILKRSLTGLNSEFSFS